MSGTGQPGDPYIYERRCELTKTQVFPQRCGGFGDPIYPSTGQNRQREVDYASASGQLRFVRNYDSNAAAFRPEWDIGFIAPVKGATGACMPALSQDTSPHMAAIYCYEEWNVEGTKAWLSDVSGAREEFSWDGTTGSPLATYFNGDKLTAATVSGQPGYLLKRVTDGHFSLINASGKTTSVVDHSGASTSLTYSTSATPVSVAPGLGYVVAQSDQFGRTIQFTYSSNGYLASLIDPSGQVITYMHSPAGVDGDIPSARTSRPSTVVYQDGSSRSYLWDEPAWSSGSVPVNRLTGVLDEMAIRFASFGYLEGTAVTQQSEI
jgi:hypothetical protein